jgi:hypothetical protein
MKPLITLAIASSLLVGACSFKHETVERPATPATTTTVATPTPSGTVVYSEPATASSTTVYTTR